MSIYDQISSPILQRAYAYVMSKRRDGCLSSRSQIDPMDMVEWLAHTELLEVVNQGETFRYRMAGGEIERIFHGRLHGHRLEDVFTGDVLDFKLLMFRRCAENRTILLSNNTLERGGRTLLEYERILIPLSENGRDVDMLFGCIYPMKLPVEKFSMMDPTLALIAEQVVEDTPF